MDQLTGDDFKTLNEGQRVGFEVVQGPREPAAEKVQAVQDRVRSKAPGKSSRGPFLRLRRALDAVPRSRMAIRSGPAKRAFSSP